MAKLRELHFFFFFGKEKIFSKFWDFLKKSDFFRCFHIFGFLDFCWKFLQNLVFIWGFWGDFLDFIWDFLRFLDFLDFLDFFLDFLDFFQSYYGYYKKLLRLLLNTKNKQKQHKNTFFCPQGKKSHGRRPNPSAGARRKPA